MVKCLQVKSLERKSCCASCIAKQISIKDISARGTIPITDGGRAVIMSIAHACR
jgi:hypothetical protein